MYSNVNNICYKKLKNGILTVYGLVFLVLWSFSEASFWFIAPDFLLILYCLLNPQNYKKYAVYALLGSLVGGIFYYSLFFLFPVANLEHILKNTPFVVPRMFEFINNVYNQYGHLGVLYQSASFMQFKIWTFMAVKHNFNPYCYFPLVIISRFLRLFAVSFAAAMLGKLAKLFLQRHIIVIVIAHCIGFMALLISVEL